MVTRLCSHPFEVLEYYIVRILFFCIAGHWFKGTAGFLFFPALVCIADRFLTEIILCTELLFATEILFLIAAVRL